MVVLLRSRAGKAEMYTREFARLQVPLAVARGGFFACVEVTDLLNLLRLLDNPLQDLPLLAVLRSPLVGLACDDLALIRATLRKGRLWTAMLRWHAEQSQAQAQADADFPAGAFARVSQFLDRYRRWRDLARQHALSQCLEEVLVETHYDDWCRAQDRGAQRHANVLRLVEMARQYDPLQRQGLYRFLNFIEAQLEEELDAEPAPLAAENAVRLMTIHQSKGLEFPVVALAGLHTRFNEDDLRQDIILDPEAGFCPKVKPPATGRRYPSVAHWFAARRGRAELLAEELRLLYVALTRASDQLILTAVATHKNLDEKWPEAAKQTPAHLFRSAHSFLDWIGPWLQTGAGTPDWAQSPEGSSNLLQWHLHSADAEPELSPEDAAGASIPASHPSTLDPRPSPLSTALRLQWQYPHRAATLEPGKTSVSILRRRAPIEDEDALAAARFLPATGFERVRTGGAMGAADIGKAHHLFLELASFSMLSGESALRAEAQRLTEAGLLSEAQADALDFPALAAFWNSETGLRLRSQEPRLHREHPFTARLDAADLQALGLPSPHGPLDGEFIVVQGVADLVAVLEHEIWVLDFKTDHPRANEWEAKVRQYTPQLQIYALALSRIYQRPATRLWLHFLRRHETVVIPPVATAGTQSSPS
jgi:ATP-dependent helicase/nuclease subunit A